jgi:hypothetical protein
MVMRVMAWAGGPSGLPSLSNSQIIVPISQEVVSRTRSSHGASRPQAKLYHSSVTTYREPNVSH